MNHSNKPMLVIGVAVLLMAAFSLYQNRSRQEIVPWRTDFVAATEEAAQSNRPVFAYFTADWCGPCQSLKGTTWASEDVKQALSGYVPVKLDIDQHPEIANRFQVRSIPAFIVIDGSGRPSQSTAGALPPEQFISWLNQR